MNDYNPFHTLYRSRDGLFLGVCKGLAQSRNIPTWVVRAFFIVAALLSSLWPVVLVYILLGLLMRPEPLLPPQSQDEQDFYDTAAQSRSRAIHRLKKAYDAVERRTRNLEHVLISKEADWERRLRERG